MRLSFEYCICVFDPAIVTFRNSETFTYVSHAGVSVVSFRKPRKAWMKNPTRVGPTISICAATRFWYLIVQSVVLIFFTKTFLYSLFFRLSLSRTNRDERLADIDRHMQSALAPVSSNIIKACLPGGQAKPFPHNCFSLMVLTGAKGSTVNHSQVRICERLNRETTIYVTLWQSFLSWELFRVEQKLCTPYIQQ